MKLEPTIPGVDENTDVIGRYQAKNEIWTPANAISFFRILLVIPAIYLLTSKQFSLTAALFCFAYLTDILDGFVARKTHDVTELGKVIDPIADKIFVASVVLAMLAVGLLPIWFVAVIVSRDIIILLAGIWATRRFKVVLPSNYPGKAAAFSTAATLFLSLLGVSDTVLVFMMSLSIALLILSLFVYGVRVFSLLQKANTSTPH
ncbi:MAG: CDP-alcohol phosphatidyltransferase family protein [Candidatus Kapaibacterium sp.]|jgi:CDP-diacylglycerol--glycerol-3-phosphate 3-phosphatidyltransferase